MLLLHHDKLKYLVWEVLHCVSVSFFQLQFIFFVLIYIDNKVERIFITSRETMRLSFNDISVIWWSLTVLIAIFLKLKKYLSFVVKTAPISCLFNWNFTRLKRKSIELLRVRISSKLKRERHFCITFWTSSYHKNIYSLSISIIIVELVSFKSQH